MRVISLKPLREFWERHPDAETPLRSWYRATKAAKWKSMIDVRKTYSSADGVRNKKGETLTVFNLGGNKYRLVARIQYGFQLVNVRHALTHQEYSTEKWKD